MSVEILPEQFRECLGSFGHAEQVIIFENMRGMVLKFLQSQRDFLKAVLKSFRVQLEARQGKRFIDRGSDAKHLSDILADGRFIAGEIFAIPRRRREMREWFEKLEEEYNSLEPLLKVASFPVCEAFAWSGDTTIVFPHRTLPGNVSVAWNRGTLECKLAYWGGRAANAPPAFGNSANAGKIIGASTYGAALCPDESLRLDGIVDQFIAMFPTTQVVTFTPATVTRRFNGNPIAFTRYSYLGLKIRWWRKGTSRFVREQDGSVSAPSTTDSDDTALFGRRARLTQTLDEKESSRSVITVTLAGAPLTSEEERLLRQIVSFVAGARGELICEEWYSADADRLGGVFYDASEPGATKSPPFEMWVDPNAFTSDTWTALCDGFSSLIADKYPLYSALHHLHDSNAGYYEVEIKNLLFCIHTLFERWADVEKQRKIVVPEAAFKRARDAVQACAVGHFGFSEEATQAVSDAIRYSNARGGGILQELFFDSLGIALDPIENKALHLRNQLFHNGYIKHDTASENELQNVLNCARALRTLAHLAILKLAGYNGMVYDWQHFKNRECRSGYPSA